jgi:hypothetical protein
VRLCVLSEKKSASVEIYCLLSRMFGMLCFSIYDVSRLLPVEHVSSVRKLYSIVEYSMASTTSLDSPS